MDYGKARFEKICKGCAFRNGLWCEVNPNVRFMIWEKSSAIPPRCPRFLDHKDFCLAHFPEEYDCSPSFDDVTAVCRNNLGIEDFFDAGVEYLIIGVLSCDAKFIKVQDKFGEVREMDPMRFDIVTSAYKAKNNNLGERKS